MPHTSTIQILLGCLILIIITLLNLRLYVSRKKIEKSIIRLAKSSKLFQWLDEKAIAALLYSRTGTQAIVESLPKLSGSGSNPALDKMDKLMQESDFYDSSNNLTKGFLDFRCPPDMKTGKSERIEAEIFLSRAFYDLVADKSTIFEIAVAKVMSAELKAGEAFKIERLHSEKQVIAKNRKTTWKWDVKPLKKGSHSLILLLCANLKAADGIEGSFDIPIFEKKIIVTVSYSYSLETFFSKNWQWLIGSVLGTGVLWTILKLFKISS